MNDDEYKNFVEDVYAGRILIGLDRSMARQIYTRMLLSKMKQVTGEAPYLQKGIIIFAFTLGYITLLGAIVMAAIAFKWWSFLIIPVGILIWFMNISMSSMGKWSMRHYNKGLLIALALIFWGEFIQSRQLLIFILLYIFALWCTRFVYNYSAEFLRMLIVQDRKAFDAFASIITLKVREAG